MFYLKKKRISIKIADIDEVGYFLFYLLNNSLLVLNLRYENNDREGFPFTTTWMAVK